MPLLPRRSARDAGRRLHARLAAATSAGLALLLPAVCLADEVAKKAAAASGDDSLFITGRTPVLIALILFLVAFFYYLADAKKRDTYFIRRIAALEAIEEAIGRATEMGRPVLFMPGIEDLDNVQTLAGLSVLSHIARQTAENGVDIFVPNRYGMVMSTAQEVVKESHLRAGRPDSYKADNIYYVSEEQFALTAHADGLMEREKPAANFFMGSFYAESLILAETGYATGAIQIAGTANSHQLPFFVAACDYCLIGEELYAASAYLSRDARQMAGIKGQDIIKIGIVAVAVLGILLAPLAPHVDAFAELPSWFSPSE